MSFISLSSMVLSMIKMLKHDEHRVVVKINRKPVDRLFIEANRSRKVLVVTTTAETVEEESKVLNEVVDKDLLVM